LDQQSFVIFAFGKPIGKSECKPKCITVNISFRQSISITQRKRISVTINKSICFAQRKPKCFAKWSSFQSVCKPIGIAFGFCFIKPECITIGFSKRVTQRVSFIKPECKSVSVAFD
jgi:hypothetical protein